MALEVVSVHIPKTAGTSFRNILEYVYGPTAVLKVDLQQKSGLSKMPDLTSKVRVIHGHSRFEQLEDHYGIDQAVRLITWIRNPVDRVISQYYYLSKVLAQTVDEQGRQIDVSRKMFKSLEEFVTEPANQNIMSRFLRDKPLEAFDFVGILEEFASELRCLGYLLNWKKFPYFYFNQTKKEGIPGTEIQALIREHNHLDVELYEQALALREKRVKVLSVSPEFQAYRPKILEIKFKKGDLLGKPLDFRFLYLRLYKQFFMKSFL